MGKQQGSGGHGIRQSRSLDENLKFFEGSGETGKLDTRMNEKPFEEPGVHTMPGNGRLRHGTASRLARDLQGQ